MTGPTPHQAATARANALLRVRLEELTAAYEWMTEQAGRIHREAAALTGSAESTDGMVVATVGPRGRLVSLTLDPRASRRVSTKELASAIVDTVNRAATDANARMAALVGPILPAGVPADEVAAGAADPATWMPRAPLTGDAFDAWWQTIRKQAEPGRDPKGAR